jgi:hypothetical protein
VAGEVNGVLVVRADRVDGLCADKAGRHHTNGNCDEETEGPGHGSAPEEDGFLHDPDINLTTMPPKGMSLLTGDNSGRKARRG